MGPLRGAATAGTLSAPRLLSPGHDVASFDCGRSVLDTWLRERALKNQGRFSRTYVACEGARVVAFVSLLAGSVERAAAPGALRRNAPDPIPVAIIGRLAVDRAHAGKGVGAAMLADALRRIAAASRTIGIGAVLVHAKDDAARAFYLRCAEFVESPADPRTLLLPIDTLLAAFK